MKRPRKRASSVAVIDIGSNSVRLVVYETMARSLVTIFNEKALCGLGREVQTTGLLARRCRRQGADVAAALSRAVPDPEGRPRLSRSPPPPAATPPTVPISSPRPNASAACRFEILSGPREAKLSALGVVSGIHNPDGIVGDLGGGSLELIDVRGNRVSSGVTLPLGSLALQDLSHKSLKRAERIVSTDLSDVAQLKAGQRPHLLCGRRHLARAGAHPHRPERLSAAGDARLFDSRPPTRWISRGGCAGSRRPTCSPISKSSPTRGGRC